MSEFEDMIALLKACAPERDARSAALTALLGGSARLEIEDRKSMKVNGHEV